MKIVFYHESLRTNGVLSFLYRISKELRKLGHSISVVKFCDIVNEFSPEKFYDVPYEFAMFKSPKQFKEGLWQYLTELKPDIVISDWWSSLPVEIIRLLKSRGIPVILYLHDISFHCPPLKLLSGCANKICRNKKCLKESLQPNCNLKVTSQDPSKYFIKTLEVMKNVHCVSPSKFMQSQVKNFGVESKLIYHGFNSTCNKKKNIGKELLILQNWNKGTDTNTELSLLEKLSKNFIIRLPKHFKIETNRIRPFNEFHPALIEKILKTTGCLLHFSMAKESFCISVEEARSFGVPVVAIGYPREDALSELWSNDEGYREVTTLEEAYKAVKELNGKYIRSDNRRTWKQTAEELIDFIKEIKCSVQVDSTMRL